MRVQPQRSHQRPTPRALSTATWLQYGCLLVGCLVMGHVGADEPTDPAAASLKLTRKPASADAAGWTIDVHAGAMASEEPLIVECSLRRCPDGLQRWSQRYAVSVDEVGTFEPIDVAPPAIDEAGVYELTCRLLPGGRASWFSIRRVQSPLATAVDHFVKPVRVDADPVRWRAIGAIRPSDSRWFVVGSWWPKSGQPRVDAGGDLSELAPGETFTGRLPTAVEGQPHRITIRLPADQAAHLEVSVGPPWMAESARTTARFRTEPWLGEAGRETTRRSLALLHHPRGEDEIRIVNLDPVSTLAFESISVEAGPPALPRVESLTEQNQDQDQDQDRDQDRDQHRSVLLLIGEAEWIGALTADVDSDERFAPGTWLAHRRRVACDRLGDLLVASRCDGVILPGQRPGEEDTVWRSDVIESLRRRGLRVWLRYGILPGDTPASLGAWVRYQGPVDGLLLGDDRGRPGRLPAYPAPSDWKTLDLGDTPIRWVDDDPRGAPPVVSLRSTVGGLPGQTEYEQRVRADLPIDAIVWEPDGCGSDRAVHDLRQLIEHHRPTWLAIAMPVTAGGFPEPFARTCAVFSQMPRQAWAVIPGIEAEVRTTMLAAFTGQRTGIEAADTFLAINRSPWSNELRLAGTFRGEWTVAGPGTIRSSDQRLLVIDLPPSAVTVLRGPPGTALKAWAVRVSGGIDVVNRIQATVTDLAQSIGWLTDPPEYEADGRRQLRGGDFEIADDSEPTGDSEADRDVEGEDDRYENCWVGWMRAQHPPGCVSIDDTIAASGRCSVCLRPGDIAGSRPWMVSDTFPAPATRRLGVSMALRSDRSGDHDRVGDETANPARLRVAIEGTHRGDPMRHAREIEIPRDGRWVPRTLVLEVDGLPVEGVENLRLTVDSLASAPIWIDQIRLHERFPTAAERAEIQTLTFLAIQGMQTGNLTAAADLLQNRWAGELIRLPSAPTSPATSVTHDSRPIPTNRLDRTFKTDPFRSNGSAIQAIGESPSAKFDGPLAAGDHDADVRQRSNGRPVTRPNRAAAGADAQAAGIAERLRGWLPGRLRL